MDEEEDWELSCSDVGILGVMRSSVVFSLVLVDGSNECSGDSILAHDGMNL